ncbi:MAG: UbiD family decarboxylase [Desulfobacterales bacterium]|nr:UbiD family decarboxylase [Desulfobacterales bacterium]
MKDLRSFIAECEKKLPKEFVRISKEVDPKFEVTVIVKKFDHMGKHPLLLFDKVKGYDSPVVCNTDDSWAKFGLALGIPPEPKGVQDYYDQCEEETIRQNKYPIKEVKKSDAPCKEVIKVGKEASLYDFPFLTHHENEVPYLTRAIGVASYGKITCPHSAHYRLMIKKPDRGVTHLTPGKHLWDIYNEKCAQNKPLEIAFVLGIHPALAMASQSRIAHPPSEFDIAGTLLKESVEMVRCETIDVLVPAWAEIIIEGEIPPNVLEEEGPWGDFSRYHQVAQRHPVQIKAITHRKNPIAHDMGAWPGTGFNIMGRIPQSGWMTRQIKEVVPDVKAFKFGPTMVGYITLDKKHIAQPKQAILAAFAHDLYLKYVVCFDTDIDLDKGSEIAWALLTRVQADRDVMILPAVLGSDLDISAPQEGVVTKVGIDATAKPFRKSLPPERKIPDDVMNRLNLKDYVAKPEDYI